MTLTELIPEIHTLPHADKIRLREMLDGDLALEQEVTRLFPSGECPIWSPYEAHEAAAIMQRALDQDKRSTNEEAVL